MENDITIQDLLGEQENTESWKEEPEFLEKIERYIESISNKDSEDIQFDKSITEHNTDRISELIFQSTTDLMLYLDRSGRIIKINNAGIAFSGFNVSDIIGKRFWKMPGVFSRHNLSKFILVFINSLKGSSTTCFTCELSDKSGKQHIMEFSTYPIKKNNSIGQILVIGKDMTQYKENESQMKDAVGSLRTSEEKYRLLAHNMTDVVFTQDIDLNITYVSPSVKDIFGYSIEETYDLKIEEIMTAESYKKAMDSFQGYRHLMQDKKEIDIPILEFEYVRKDGSTFWGELKINFLKDSQGQLIASQGAIRDITERKQAEEMLRKSENNLRIFFNTVDNFHFILDAQGKIQTVNKQVTERLGYAAEELIGQSVLIVHPKEYREDVEKVINDILDGKRKTCTIPLMAKNGEQVFVETYVVWSTWDGNPAIFGTSKDISALKKSEEKFSKAFQCNPAIAGISDIETGEYIEVNRNFYKILGFTPEEVIGKRASEVVRMDIQFRDEVLEKLKRNNFIRNEEAVVYTKDGKPIDVLLSAEVITINGKKYNYTTGLDISSRKQVEEELRKANCPKFKKYLSEVVIGRKQRNLLVQEMIGLALYRGVISSNPAFFILKGSGRNGKSTLIQSIGRLIGKDNYMAATFTQVINDNDTRASMYGKLANLGAESSMKNVKELELLKLITGGDPMQARNLYSSSFSFNPYITLIFAFNEMPFIQDTSNAMLSRIHLIEFPKTFATTDKKTDTNMLEKITTKEELEGILVFAVDGLRRVLKSGHFTRIENNDEIAEIMESDIESVQEWSVDRLEFSEGDVIRKDAAFSDYEKWCNRNGIMPENGQTFKEKILQLHFTKKGMDSYTANPCYKIEQRNRGSKSNRQRVYINIRFKKGGSI